MSFRDHDKKTFIADTARAYAERRISKRDFMKKMSVLHYSQDDLQECYRDIARFADAEGLTGHAKSVSIRFEGIQDE